MLQDDIKETIIGYLPVDWNVGILGDLVSVQTGYPFSSDNFTDNDESNYYPVIRIRNIPSSSTDTYYEANLDNQTIQEFLVREGDILIGMDGNFHIGKWKTQSGLLNQRVARLQEFKRELNREYAYYAIMAPIKHIEETKHYTTVKHLSMSDLRLLKIPLPPLPEQRAIAHVLSTVRQAIDATEQVIAAAQELKRSMMKHLFTYGPVPVQEADQVPLKETEIGEIREEWPITPLDSLISEPIKNGAFIKREKFGSGVPFLNVADVYKGLVVNIDELERVNSTQDEVDNFGLAPNDLVFVRSSLKREGVGQCCIVDEIDEPSIFDCHLMRVRINKDKAEPKFIAYYYVSPIGKNSLISRSKTTTMTTINQSGLSSAIAPLPSLSEQTEIRKYLTILDLKIHSEFQTKSSYEVLFSSLLHQLMTGKVRVAFN